MKLLYFDWKYTGIDICNKCIILNSYLIHPGYFTLPIRSPMELRNTMF